MRRWARLNERQLKVLERIGAAEHVVSAREPDLARTVYALRGRGLVVTPRRDGVWEAEITEAGRFYLEHGRHPEDPSLSAKPAEPEKRARRRSAEPGEGGQGGRLIEQLLTAENMTLRFDDPDDGTRGFYRRAIAAVRTNDLAPRGMRVRYTGRDIGDLVIQLVDVGADETEWNRIRLSIRDNVTTPGGIAAILNEDPDALDVSEESRPRALRLLALLAAEAKRRGYRLAVSRDRKPRAPYVVIADGRYLVEIHEMDDGQLAVRTPDPEMGEEELYRVSSEWNPDSTLMEVFAELETRAAQAAQRERQRQEMIAEWERQDAADLAEWQTAVKSARRGARARYRRSVFGDALRDRTHATEIRRLCDDLEAEAKGPEHPYRAAIARWVRWARSWADSIDPVQNLSRLSRSAFDREPDPEELIPFLGDWDPEEPIRLR